jgi:cyclophilin family peptidyl-prolyl cis-trans isomerase
MAPPSSRGNRTMRWVGGAAAVLVLLGVVYFLFLSAPGGPGSSTPGASRSPGPRPTPAGTLNAAFMHPPSATPLASPPAQPAGDGTTATIVTDRGTIKFELYNLSAPVASENFENLANAGFYNGIIFHRLVPDFMIQGGDPNGTGSGGPPWKIPDEPIVGQYTRGMVAMARTSAPNSQGSQFFIIVKDSPFLAGGNYTIFGRVTEGMDVVDQIVSLPTANDDPGGRGGTALDPVVMTSVTVQTPGT